MNSIAEIPLALRAAYLALHRQSDAAFSEHGVTADQFVLLETLAKGEALTQRDLALRMRPTQALSVPCWFFWKNVGSYDVLHIPRTGERERLH